MPLRYFVGMITDQQAFSGITSASWEHPADRAALRALKSVPGMDDIVKWFLGATTEKSLRLLFLSSSVRVSETQFPRVHQALVTACRVLDVPDLPEVYVTQNPVMNAGAIGVDKAFISLNSGLVERASDDELLFVVAHELGHILSGHVLYLTLLWLLVNAGAGLARLPLTGLVLMGVLAALREWQRRAELSCDRAALLVTQDREIGTDMLMKLAGGGQTDQMDTAEFLRQAEEYDASTSVSDSIYKLLNLIGQTHPFPVLRVAGLREWAESEEYSAILRGEYPKAGSSEERAMNEELDRAARAYREEFQNSGDPLSQMAGRLADGFDTVRKEAQGFFASFFGGPGGGASSRSGDSSGGSSSGQDSGSNGTNTEKTEENNANA